MSAKGRTDHPACRDQGGIVLAATVFAATMVLQFVLVLVIFSTLS